jgi:hypothetical protein
MFVYIGIGLDISFILPFPISLSALFLVFILLNIYWTNLALMKPGRGGIKGLYKSMSSSFANWSSGFDVGGVGYNPIKFYCINCGYEPINDACSKCGSKAVKVG